MTCSVPGCVDRWGSHGPHCDATAGPGVALLAWYGDGTRAGEAAIGSPCVLEPGHADAAHVYAAPGGRWFTVRTKDGQAWYVTARTGRL